MASSGIIDKKAGIKFTPGTVAAMLVVVGMSVGAYWPLHIIHDQALSHPAIIIMLPFVTVAYVGLLLPLLMYITYPEDFKGLFPMNPEHYLKIVHKAYTALGKNNLKVSVKDM